MIAIIPKSVGADYMPYLLFTQAFGCALRLAAEKDARTFSCANEYDSENRKFALAVRLNYPYLKAHPYRLPQRRVQYGDYLRALHILNPVSPSFSFSQFEAQDSE